MPNLGDNRMIVRGPTADLARLLRKHLCRATGSGAAQLDFGSIIPVAAPRSPDELMRAWGTKWNARDKVVINKSRWEMEINFITAWAFPERVYRQLGRLYPGLLFLIDAIDPDWWAIEGRVEGGRAQFREVADFNAIFNRFYTASRDDRATTNSVSHKLQSDTAGSRIRMIERNY